MNTRKSLARLGLGGLLIAGIALGAAPVALAGHQWDDFHLQMPSDDTGAETGPADVTVYLNNTGNALIAEAAMLTLLGSSVGSVGEWVAVIPDTDWTGGDVAITGTGGNGVPTSGVCCDDAFNVGFLARMEDTDALVEDGSVFDLTPGSPSAVNSYNDNYENTGWLGIAVVQDSESQGTGAAASTFSGQRLRPTPMTARWPMTSRTARLPTAAVARIVLDLEARSTRLLQGDNRRRQPLVGVVHLERRLAYRQGQPGWPDVPVECRTGQHSGDGSRTTSD